MNEHDAAKILGRLGGLKGGKARAEALTQERRSEIASIAARARWGANHSPLRTKHRTEYLAFCNARIRCTSKKCKSWARYGGRGIKFLFTSFEQFLADVGPRPNGHLLDRIDNDGHYEPGNMRWATPRASASNRLKA